MSTTRHRTRQRDLFANSDKSDLYKEMQETSVIQLDGDSKVSLVFGQMNEPPGARARVALTGYVPSPENLTPSTIPPSSLTYSPPLSNLLLSRSAIWLSYALL